MIPVCLKVWLTVRDSALKTCFDVAYTEKKNMLLTVLNFSCTAVSIADKCNTVIWLVGMFQAC